jgi:2-hydroxychromene-2-carboxylate isomerase
LDPTDPDRLADLTQRLQPARSPEAEDVKASLRHGTEQAIADGVFGVPSIRVDQEVFWGLDALPMLREYLDGDDWYRSPAWTSAVNLPEGIRRKR